MTRSSSGSSHASGASALVTTATTDARRNGAHRACGRDDACERRVVRLYGTGATSFTGGSGLPLHRGEHAPPRGSIDAAQADRRRHRRPRPRRAAAPANWVAQTVALRDGRTSISIDRPATRVDGDFLLVSVTAQGLDTGTICAPDGTWTQVRQSTQGAGSHLDHPGHVLEHQERDERRDLRLHLPSRQLLQCRGSRFRRRRSRSGTRASTRPIRSTIRRRRTAARRARISQDLHRRPTGPPRPSRSRRRTSTTSPIRRSRSPLHHYAALLGTACDNATTSTGDRIGYLRPSSRHRRNGQSVQRDDGNGAGQRANGRRSR